MDMDVDKMIAQNALEQQLVRETLQNTMQRQALLTSEACALRQVAKFVKARQDPKSKVLKGQTMGLRPKDVDLDGAETLADKLRRVAERAPMRQVNLTETTILLMHLGAGQTRKNLRASISQCLDRMPDAQKIARGWWQVIPRGALNDTHVSLDHQEVGEGAGEEIELPDEDLRLKPMQWKTGSVDYSQAHNLAVRVILLAGESKDGYCDPNQVAARLIADHQSTQRPTSLGRLVAQTMRKLPEFVELRNGWFFYESSRPRRTAGH